MTGERIEILMFKRKWDAIYSRAIVLLKVDAEKRELIKNGLLYHGLKWLENTRGTIT